MHQNSWASHLSASDFEVIDKSGLTDELLEIIDEGDYSQLRSSVRISRTTAVTIADAIRRGKVGAASLQVLADLYASSVERLLRQTFS